MLSRWQALRAALAGLDWHVALMLGPRHRFSAEQWARLDLRAGISPSVKVAAGINALLLAGMVAGLSEPGMRAASGLITLLMAALLLRLGAAVWRRPTLRALYLGYAAVVAVGVFSTFLLGVYSGFVGMDQGMGQRSAHRMFWVLLTASAFGLWVLAMFRNEMLAARLREEEQQQQALALARQLSSAQIQPHFLFNTLASLQHWVDRRDERAAPLLQSLTGYLRATLPLFDRPLLPLADEAEAVRRYLEVMQARLGERLHFRVDVEPAAAAHVLPPGLLLTLVENAVEHGVQAQLAGGEVRLRAAVLADGSLLAEVEDDGPGVPTALELTAPDAAPAHADAGHGLHNCALRLAQAFGPRARLCLRPAPSGGCLAQVRVQPEGRRADGSPQATGA